MKQQILCEIISKLSKIGLPAQEGNGTDITINTEFLDAKWSTGSKKITYEALIFLNDQENVIYMYEKTREAGDGLSFGGSSNSTFQSGTTLFRKVKSIQYGAEGKAYEIDLDLGSIPKAMKDTAKQYGWKFKNVINKNKAMYPIDYKQSPIQESFEQDPQMKFQAASFCTNCGASLIQGVKFCEKCGSPVKVPQPKNTPPVHSPAPSKKSKGKSIFFWLCWFGLLSLCLIMTLYHFSVFSVSAYLGLLSLLLIFRKKISRRWFIAIGIWIMAFIIFLLTVGIDTNNSQSIKDIDRIQEAFQVKDTEKIAEYLHPANKDKMKVIFESHKNELDKVARLMETKKLIYVDEGYAEYEVRDGNEKYIMIFEKVDGKWRLSRF